MSEKRSVAVHLWVYNHPFHGISDQVGFFNTVFRQHGYPVTVGRQPRRESLNVVIENFDVESRAMLESFCRTTGKRVAVIMTEHLDFLGEQIHIHGMPLWSHNDYMHPATQVARIRNLIECLPWIRCFLVLGDLPKLQNFDTLLPGLDVRWLPFPELAIEDIKVVPEKVHDDLLFTGFITEYRANILAMLRAMDFKVTCPEKFVSRSRRDDLNRTARMILNIPQRKGWQWLSLMRIIAALCCGRATVSLETQDVSEIAVCTYQLPMSAPDWEEQLWDHVVHWRKRFEDALAAYQDMARNFTVRHPFPHDMIEFWAITEGLGAQHGSRGAA